MYAQAILTRETAVALRPPRPAIDLPKTQLLKHTTTAAPTPQRAQRQREQVGSYASHVDNTQQASPDRHRPAPRPVDVHSTGSKTFTRDNHEKQMRHSKLPSLPSGANLHVVTPGWAGNLGTGGRVWPGAAAMCQLLVSMQPELQGSSVLELGAGAGAVGIFAAALGASRVLLTDGGEGETALAKLNARRHSHLYRGATVDAHKYLWGEPLAGLMAGDKHFDFVLGADITYSLPLLPPLCDTLAELRERHRERHSSSEGPIMLLSHQVNRHGERELPRILSLVAAGRGLDVRPLDAVASVSIPNVVFYSVT